MALRIGELQFASVPSQRFVEQELECDGTSAAPPRPKACEKPLGSSSGQARDAAKTGRLGKERNDAWRRTVRFFFGASLTGDTRMATEFEIIARYFTRPARTAVLGVGDDAAIVRVPAELALAITTDLLAEGTHFLADTDAGRLGHKALAVNLSDLAAMGADPRWFTIALALPGDDEAWLAAFAQGMFGLADRFGVELIGGDTTRGPRTISITACGTLPPGLALRRDGAAIGEDVWLSGATGDAALGLAHLRRTVRLADAAARHCLARLETPLPLVALGRRLRGVASSAIDVSDGLVADLGHIAERSAAAIEIWLDELPRSKAIAECPDAALARECLLGGGDDYELAFTAPVGQRAAILALATEIGLPLTRIGRTHAGDPAVTVLDGAGAPVAVRRAGFDHFGA